MKVLTVNRAHATQYDLPFSLIIDKTLPALDDCSEPFSLSAFTALCDMFTSFHEATSDEPHSTRTLMLLHDQLKLNPRSSQYHNDMQRADLSITQQWMRLMLWKLAVNRLPMNADPSGDISSMLFPVRVARDLLAHMSSFSIDTLEAHGPGMELKLFEFANTLANVVMCLPPQARNTYELGPKDYLIHLHGVLHSFRGGNGTLVPLLQSRLAEVGLAVPVVPRIIELNHESTDSYHSRFDIESDDVQDGSPEGRVQSASAVQSLALQRD